MNAQERIEQLKAEVAQLTASRDSARDLAVALEGQLARVEALADKWERDELGTDRYCAREVRAALSPEQPA